MQNDAVVARVVLMAVVPPRTVDHVDLDIASEKIAAGVGYDGVSEVRTGGRVVPAGKDDIVAGRERRRRVEPASLPEPPDESFFDGASSPLAHPRSSAADGHESCRSGHSIPGLQVQLLGFGEGYHRHRRQHPEEGKGSAELPA